MIGRRRSLAGCERTVFREHVEGLAEAGFQIAVVPRRVRTGKIQAFVADLLRKRNPSHSVRVRSRRRTR